jgi:hypothetical protein
MPVVNTIQLRRDTLTNWTSVNPTLAAGEVGYDSTSNKIKIGNGSTAWNSLEYASGGASILVSATAPVDPEVGDVWFNTETGISYVYYDSFWTSIAGSSGAPIISDTAPASPVLGMQWFNSSTGKSYLYYSNAWVEIDSNGTSALSGNAIINGAFDINQRGFTSLVNPLDALGFDRWRNLALGDGTATFSAQTFTPGAAPIAGYEGTNFIRCVTSGQSSSAVLTRTEQRIEDVRSFAGQTITISFFAKANSGTPSINVGANQSFGTGGSTEVLTRADNFSITTSWARYSVTLAIPSISGKTIGPDNSLRIRLNFSAGSNSSASTNSLPIQNNTFDLWGVQVEAGPTANVFRRNANSLQGELAACQRYYYRFNSPTAGNFLGFGSAYSATGFLGTFQLPVPLRVPPTGFDAQSLRLYDGVSAATSVTSVLVGGSQNLVSVEMISSGMTTYRPYHILSNTLPSFIGFSAEL